MSEYEELTPQEFEEKCRKRMPDSSMHTFSPVMFQSALCVILLLLLYIAKLVLPDIYREIRSWYDAEMERSVLIEYDDRIFTV